jgi:hypothetical protein
VPALGSSLLGLVGPVLEAQAEELLLGQRVHWMTCKWVRIWTGMVTRARAERGRLSPNGTRYRQSGPAVAKRDQLGLLEPGGDAKTTPTHSVDHLCTNVTLPPIGLPCAVTPVSFGPLATMK